MKAIQFGMVLLLATGALAHAGEEGVGSGEPVFMPPMGGGPLFTPPLPPRGSPAGPVIVGETVSTQSTTTLVDALDAANRFCAGLDDDSYVVDCLAAELEAIANQLPQTGDYAEVRRVLSVAWQDLYDLTTENLDTAKPAGVATTTGATPRKSARAIRPVSPAKVQEVKRKAVDIVTEAQTSLLRSTETADLRRVHFERVATAIGSNKVLLRAA